MKAGEEEIVTKNEMTKLEKKQRVEESQIEKWKYTYCSLSSNCCRGLKQLSWMKFSLPNEANDIKVTGNEFKRLKEISQVCNCKEGLCMISIET